jgi:hypothetical protein
LTRAITLFGTLLLLACSKQEVVLIEGNKAPDEVLVSQSLKENYVNRVYIALTGRKADPVEFESALLLLGDQAPELGRRALLETIVELPSYNQYTYDKARNDYIDGVDTATIKRDQFIFTNLLVTADPITKEILELEIKRLQRLRNIMPGLIHDSLNLVDIHKRMVDNGYYDEINMGTENFVVASFQHFLFRYPTQIELAQSSNMVDGFSGQLFFQNGSSKTDFIELFFSSNGYSEGLVIALFQENLFRDPTTAEMAIHTQALATSKDYKDFQVDILSGDEYFFN